MDKWMTVKEASEASGYTIRWIRQLAREEKIKVKRWGWSFMIDEESLMKYKKEKDEKRDS